MRELMNGEVPCGFALKGGTLEPSTHLRWLLQLAGAQVMTQDVGVEPGDSVWKPPQIVYFKNHSLIPC